MRRIKLYKDFQLVNESIGFHSSEEYRLLKEKYDKLSKEYFQEHFYDITDENIADVSYWSYIGSDKGRGDAIDISVDQYICYVVNINPKDKGIDTSSVDSLEELKKVADNISKIINSIKEFESRIQSDGLTIVQTTTRGTTSRGYISLVIRGDKISKGDLEKYYGGWKSGRGPKYFEGVKRLKEEYRKNGIPNADLDTNESFNEEDEIAIGFMMIEDEIICVATYSKRHDDFDIDWSEFRRSIKEYREQQ